MQKEQIVTERRNKPYKDGELEIILSLVPTKSNIQWLACLLDRSEQAIVIVYRIAYGHGKFGTTAGIQKRKILAAKKRVGISV